MNERQDRIHGNSVADGWVEAKMQQVTRGHNIVADGWAGASNLHPHPNPHIALLDDFSVIMCHRCATESGGAF